MGRGFLIQMGGHAGSGKSTIARRVAERTGATVLDLDTIKSSLLEVGLDWDTSSKGSYAVIYALVDDLLSIDGGKVIVDTPSYWAEINARLTAVADLHAATYVFVECEADESARALRLGERSPRRSQVAGLDSNPSDAPGELGVLHHRQVERPTGRSCVVVRTDRQFSLDSVLGDSGLHDFVEPEAPSEGT
jgi:predicted kinase